MNISFHGAARTVTGSKHLVNLDNGQTILLDCGMFQGLGGKTQRLNDTFGFDPRTISVVLLSHAHIDHSGLLPKLVAEGFIGKIFCTAATRDLTAILLYDSATIQAHDNSETHQPPSYSLDDVFSTLEKIQIVPFGEWFEALPGTEALFTPTGHLAGAAAIHLKIHEKAITTTITYSADIGRSRHPLLKPAEAFPQSEYIILESTYGDKHHNLLTSNIDILFDYIQNTCLKKQGQLIIPAFSIGRTQEILHLLHQLEKEGRLPDLKYFVDSPLAIKATEIIKAHPSEFNEHIQPLLAQGGDPFSFTGLKYVGTTEDSIRLKEFQDPCVIIASSGTADAGRVRHHIAASISNPKNTILFSGYCSPESTGGELLAGKKIVEIKETTFEVHASIAQLKGLSAHGDSDDLCQFIACQDPGLVRAVYLVHGDNRAQEKLASRLKGKGFYPVICPEIHETVELNRNSRHSIASDSTADQLPLKESEIRNVRLIRAPTGREVFGT